MLKQKINRFMFRSRQLAKKYAPKSWNVKKAAHQLAVFVNSWWQVLLLVSAAVIFLYYPLGGWLMNDINTNTEYEINNKHNEQSAAIAMNAFLVNREVNEKMWTPNLPFFFPSYFLDNMPNFQMGIISSVSNVTTALSKRLEKTIAENEALHLEEAAKLLRYPGTIWIEGYKWRSECAMEPPISPNPINPKCSVFFDLSIIYSLS